MANFTRFDLLVGLYGKLLKGVGMLSWNLRLAFHSSWLKWYRFVEVSRETIFGAHVKHSADTHAVCRLSICTLQVLHPKCDISLLIGVEELGT